MPCAGAGVRPYASPIAEAKRLRALRGSSAWASVPRRDRATAMRLAVLAPSIVEALEQEEAPSRIFHWVAWGSSRQDQVRRSRLVIHLRRNVPTARGGWPQYIPLAAAWRLWRALADAARRRGWAEPAPDRISVEEYTSAMAAPPTTTRRRRSRSAPSAAPTAVVISAEEYKRYRELERLLGAATAILPQPPPPPP